MGLGIEELAEQIKTVGQQQPAVLRKKPNGKFETLIGHRRKRACILAGKNTIKAILRQCTDDEAALISKDNLGQRLHTFLSEIAKAYEIQMQALKNQGKRTDLLKRVEEEKNFGQELPEVEDKEQLLLAEVINFASEITISVDTAKELREASSHMTLNSAVIEATVNPPKEDRLQDFLIKPSKPVYKVAFKSYS
ncbi:MAG: hypothetical protein E7222_13360 [Clostridiales bacterium]|nr:hypothetical protein [Clostridiales bacterium]